MGNYYLDTEFIEGTQKRLFGVTKPTIDLISIGIVSEDSREYYAISKDFNLKEAWNRFDTIPNTNYKPSFGNHQDCEQSNPMYIKEYWIRDNVLKPIFNELLLKEKGVSYKQEQIIGYGFKVKNEFTYKNFKRLINKYGKSNKEIAKEIRNYIYAQDKDKGGQFLNGDFFPNNISEINFYTYYGDYDWVVFCWLFGKMINLPKGFPMYSCDLKQMLDEIVIKKGHTLKYVKSLENYPKQENVHNALQDALWNKKLSSFIKNYEMENKKEKVYIVKSAIEDRHYYSERILGIYTEKEKAVSVANKFNSLLKELDKKEEDYLLFEEMALWDVPKKEWDENHSGYYKGTREDSSFTKEFWDRYNRYVGITTEIEVKKLGSIFIEAVPLNEINYEFESIDYEKMD